MVGKQAGICYGTDTTNHDRNYERGLDCIRSGHGKAMEFVQVYMIIDGHSARLIREFGRHTAGAPTYLQSSTRYIDYSNFDYYTPPAVQKNSEALGIYNSTMYNIQTAAQDLQKLGINKEDVANILPLGMTTKIVYRTNLRALVEMAKVRKCTRAYHEYRQLFQEIEEALKIYSDEWWYLIEEEHIFKIKCEELGYCNESRSCGRTKSKEQLDKDLQLLDEVTTNTWKPQEGD